MELCVSEAVLVTVVERSYGGNACDGGYEVVALEVLGVAVYYDGGVWGL